MKKKSLLLALVSLIFLLSACTARHKPKLNVKPISISKIKKLRVIATAYTSFTKETDKTPFLAAWMNKLNPSIKSIAISRDLITMGLGNGSEVSIDGLSGKYIVLDKMNKRWRKRIDIYMGLNRKRAFRWGKRAVVIRWKKTQEELKKEYIIARDIAVIKAKELSIKKKKDESIFMHIISLF
jgi:3D (Asp-Asp-Asp) domain-containing protein